MEQTINRIRFEYFPDNVNHRSMLNWFEKNIEPSNKHNNDGDPIPYYASATSQIAKYAGQTSLWHLEIRGPQLKKVVEIADPKMAVKFALECINAN